jgi:hypothetical protein
MQQLLPTLQQLAHLLDKLWVVFALVAVKEELAQLLTIRNCQAVYPWDHLWGSIIAKVKLACVPDPLPVQDQYAAGVGTLEERVLRPTAIAMYR